jgi:hypothetical protein
VGQDRLFLSKTLRITQFGSRVGSSYESLNDVCFGLVLYCTCSGSRGFKDSSGSWGNGQGRIDGGYSVNSLMAF